MAPVMNAAQHFPSGEHRSGFQGVGQASREVTVNSPEQIGTAALKVEARSRKWQLLLGHNQGPF